MVEIKKEVDLGGYPDEESKKIAENLKAETDAKAKEEAEKGGQKTPEQIAKEAEEAKAKAEQEEAAKKAEENKKADKKDEEIKRTPRTMPLYEHEIEKKNWGKKEGELQTKISTLEEQLKGKSAPQKEEKIKKFAEKHNLEEDFVKDLLDIIGEPKADISPEVQKKLETIEAERKEQIEEKEFNKDFEKEVSPLLETDGVPEDKRKEVKELLKTLAYTTQYASTPLKVIYRGDEQFDDFKVKGRKSGEGSRAVGGRGAGETEKKMEEMTDKEFEEASDAAGAGSSNRTYSAPQ